MSRQNRNRPRVDLLSFLVGVLAIIAATLALWAAFATVPAGMIIAVPIALVLLGGLGLLLSHNSR